MHQIYILEERDKNTYPKTIAVSTMATVSLILLLPTPPELLLLFSPLPRLLFLFLRGFDFCDFCGIDDIDPYPKTLLMGFQ